MDHMLCLRLFSAVCIFQIVYSRPFLRQMKSTLHRTLFNNIYLITVIICYVTSALGTFRGSEKCNKIIIYINVW